MSRNERTRTPERPTRSSSRDTPRPPISMTSVPSRRPANSSILFSSVLEPEVPIPIPVLVPEVAPAVVPAARRNEEPQGMENVPLSTSPSADYVSVAEDLPSSDGPSPAPSVSGHDLQTASSSFGYNTISTTQRLGPDGAQSASPSVASLSSYFQSTPFFSAFSSYASSEKGSEKRADGSVQQFPTGVPPPEPPAPYLPSPAFPPPMQPSPLSAPSFHPSVVTFPSDPIGGSSFPAGTPTVTATGAPSAVSSSTGYVYSPVHPHWFFCSITEGKTTWFPFSLVDSMNLEEACLSGDTDMDTLVATDGGRYDVNVIMRTRQAVYWTEEPTPVRRATWFYREPLDTQFTPYDERFAAKLEEEYQKAAESGQWQRRLEFPSGEIIVIHGPNLIVHFPPAVLGAAWTLLDINKGDDVSGSQENVLRPCTVRRGVEDFDISDGEPQQIDHLVFMVHGIGAYCDLRFRGIVECVDDFRDLSLQMTQNHFKTRVDAGRVGRVELLPVAWHDALRGDCTGVDRQLKAITLRSIPKLRDLINDTLLDILFYTSPVYCQHIMDRVGTEINRMYNLFMKRHPDFKGHVSLAGHSLGSVILFDLLMHQPKPIISSKEGAKETGADPNKQPSAEDLPQTLDELLAELDLGDLSETLEKEKIDLDALALCEEKDLQDIGIPLGPRKKLLMGVKRLEIRRRIAVSAEKEGDDRTGDGRRTSTTSVSYSVGAAGTGQPFLSYPVLDFSPTIFFAMGSPIALFVTVRGLDNLNLAWSLPTCPSVFNIYHPFDPVAYRLESLIDPSLNEVRPVLIPHHKGRKRMHLELKEAMGRVGTEINRFADSIRTTMQTLYQYSPFGRLRPHNETLSEGGNPDSGSLDGVQGEIARQITEPPSPLAATGDSVVDGELRIASYSASATTIVQGNYDTKKRNFGMLNGSRRIDYVLQEKPIETVNEYLFALGAHLCYWESEDTMLMMLKELYAVNGVDPDETSSAHPIHSPALQQDGLADGASHPVGGLSVPQQSLTDSLLQQQQHLPEPAAPSVPFVGVNPAAFQPTVAPAVEVAPLPVTLGAPVTALPPPPPLVNPSALPSLPPSSATSGASSVVRPRHYPNVHLPPQFGLAGASSSTSPAPPLTHPPPAPTAHHPSSIRHPSLFPTSGGSAFVSGMDPTAPPSENRNIGPPPKMGFVPRHPKSTVAPHPVATPAAPALVPVPLVAPSAFSSASSSHVTSPTTTS